METLHISVFIGLVNVHNVIVDADDLGVIYMTQVPSFLHQNGAWLVD